MELLLLEGLENKLLLHYDIFNNGTIDRLTGKTT